MITGIIYEDDTELLTELELINAATEIYRSSFKQEPLIANLGHGTEVIHNTDIKIYRNGRIPAHVVILGTMTVASMLIENTILARLSDLSDQIKKYHEMTLKFDMDTNMRDRQWVADLEKMIKRITADRELQQDLKNKVLGVDRKLSTLIRLKKEGPAPLKVRLKEAWKIIRSKY